MLSRLFNRLADLLMTLACFFCFLMMLHVSTDVIARTVFNSPLIGTIEIVSAYYMAALAFLPLAWITRSRGHIIVELFTSHLPKRRLALIDGIVGVVSLAYVLLFTWQVVDIAIEKTEIGEAWEAATGFVAVWPSRWTVPLGFGLMAVFLAVNLMADFRTARRTEQTSEPGNCSDDTKGI